MDLLEEVLQVLLEEKPLGKRHFTIMSWRELYRLPGVPYTPGLAANLSDRQRDAPFGSLPDRDTL